MIRYLMIAALLGIGLYARSAWAQPDCNDWNSDDFFKSATVADVKRCLAAGAKIKARGEYGNTPLHWAAGYGDAETVAALVKAGADVNARDKYGLTPLHMAAAAAETVAALVKAGAEVNARAEGGLTPLHLAVGVGDAETVTALVKAGADMEARTNSISISWNSGSLGSIRSTEDGGIQGSGGGFRSTRTTFTIVWTPLHVAAFSGNAETVAALVEAGADPKARDRHGRFPADLAEGNPKVKDRDIFRVLEGARNAVQPDCNDWNSKGFFESAAAADVKRCLEAGAEVNARDENGYTPLHLAVRYGDAGTVAALVNAGADVEARDKDGLTPPKVAWMNGHDQMSIVFARALVRAKNR